MNTPKTYFQTPEILIYIICLTLFVCIQIMIPTQGAQAETAWK
jgi:hypothetical protein